LKTASTHSIDVTGMFVPRQPALPAASLAKVQREDRRRVPLHQGDQVHVDRLKGAPNGPEQPSPRLPPDEVVADYTEQSLCLEELPDALVDPLHSSTVAAR